MAQAMTLPIIGVLAFAGVGAGIQLGHSALAEINPIYFRKPPTRFHSDLVANPPSTSPSLMAVASSEQAAALGTGCIGCRTYPEEYYPVHDASVDDPSAVYAMNGEKVRVAAVEEQSDPDEARFRGDVERVERYARGSPELAPEPASAEVPAEPVARSEVAPITS